MRFGVLTLPMVAWGDLVEQWRYLEELDFDAIYVADALAHPRDAAERWFDAWVCLATLAQVTDRPRIGPLVTSIIFRNPSAVVNAAVSVDAASNGRLELALGAGEPSVDHELAQVTTWTPGERRDRFDAYVRRVRSLLDDDPRRPSIPLTVAAQGSGTIRVAAELGDAWNTYGGRGLSVEEGRELVRRRSEELTLRCEEIGRDPAAVRRSLLLGYHFIREQPFRSVEAFADVVETWRVIGMDEIIFYHPPELNGPPERPVEHDRFERILRDAMPQFQL
jgi:alkanesulfonate monooxygenase SsuD/methylene tetrahydromethanopterin reductase-like flavin-dependent oxidoreductase (luciferase family)